MIAWGMPSLSKIEIKRNSPSIFGTQSSSHFLYYSSLAQKLDQMRMGFLLAKINTNSEYIGEGHLIKM
jgi:hypothetical protein